jgi:predicted O-methyltransferase YrrM
MNKRAAKQPPRHLLPSISAYLVGERHGSAPEEQKRLSLLNTILNDACLRELNLRGGERVLDVGSGLGQFTRAMAHAAGKNGRVLGIERDPDQLAEAKRQAEADGEADLAEFRLGTPASCSSTSPTRCALCSR